MNASKTPEQDETLGRFMVSLNHLAHVLKPKQVVVIDTHTRAHTHSRHTAEVVNTPTLP